MEWWAKRKIVKYEAPTLGPELVTRRARISKDINTSLGLDSD